MNRLGSATSPYLLQHAGNPVDWWEWSPEAFDEAKQRDVPILLSVGYAACHWCQDGSDLFVVSECCLQCRSEAVLKLAVC